MKITTYLTILNNIINKIQLPIVINSLDECAPLLWVALIEGLLKTRITMITRIYPKDSIQRLRSKYHNIYSMLLYLEATLNIDLSHLRVELLLQGDEKAVCNLIEVLHELDKAIDKRDGTQSCMQNVTQSFMQNGTQSCMQNGIQDSFDGISEIEANDGSSFVSGISSTASLEENSHQNTQPIPLKSINYRPTRMVPCVLSMMEDEEVNAYFAIRDSKFNDSDQFLDSKNIVPSRFKINNKEMNSFMPQLTRKSKTTDYKVENTSQKTYSNKDPQTKNAAIKRQSSAPENDFKRLKTMLEDTLHKPVPDRIHSHFIDKQVNYWKSALNDKLWRRKVSAMKKIASTDQRPIRTREIEQIKDSNREIAKKEREEIRIALIDIKERERRAVKMQNRQTLSEMEKKNEEKKGEMKNERIMAQVYNDYLKKQTNDIIEKRAQARVIEKSVKLEMRHQSTQRNSLYLDQIKMYKNELESAQKEQENLTKGIKLDTKLRMREEKSILRQDIRRMKEKTICKDDFRLDEDVEKMIESIRVNTRRPNRRRLVS